MLQVLAKHKVQDYEAWKAVFDELVDFRKSSGELSYNIMHSKDHPNDLTLLFEWDNLQNAEKFMKSEELKSAMQRGGVTGAPDIQFFDQASKGTP